MLLSSWCSVLQGRWRLPIDCDTAGGKPKLELHAEAKDPPPTPRKLGELFEAADVESAKELASVSACSFR